MDKSKQEKIQRFLADKVMSEAVYDVLLKAFLGDTVANDVQYLAASRLSITMLGAAWSELEKYRKVVDAQAKELTNIGL